MAAQTVADATLETSVALLVPFTAFLTAEQVHASGVLAVVVAAFSISLNTTGCSSSSCCRTSGRPGNWG